MKPTTLIATLILASVVGMAQAAPAAAPMQPGPAASLSGEVLEVRNVDAYSYLRLKTASGEVWAAVPTAMVAKGAKVTIERPMMMENFESKTLKKTFDRIAFGTIAGAAAPAALGPGAQNGGMSPHGMGAAAGPVPAAPPMKVVKVSKASGPDGKTVAEVVSGKAALKDKAVVVRGQVVKVSSGILGKNWLHLRDGSGSEADGSHDILVTSKDIAAVGDVVIARGTVRTDVTVGPGYAYAVMIDGAALSK